MFKHFMAPSMRGFDYLPRLVAEPIVLRPRPEILFGEGRVTLPIKTVADPPSSVTSVAALGKGGIGGHSWNNGENL
jgi:hypothetical protein